MFDALGCVPVDGDEEFEFVGLSCETAAVGGAVDVDVAEGTIDVFWAGGGDVGGGLKLGELVVAVILRGAVPTALLGGVMDPELLLGGVVVPDATEPLGGVDAPLGPPDCLFSVGFGFNAGFAPVGTGGFGAVGGGGGTTSDFPSVVGLAGGPEGFNGGGAWGR